MKNKLRFRETRLLLLNAHIYRRRQDCRMLTAVRKEKYYFV